MWTGVVIGTLCALSADSWPIIWIGLEMNLISFLLVINQNWLTKRTSIIYFIVQRVGSLSILGGGFISDWCGMIDSCVTLGLLLKTRLAPLHFWGALLLAKLTKLPGYFFLTWQKIAPLFMLFLTTTKFLLVSLIIINIIVASSCRISTKNIYVLLFFSGLIHVCWVLSSPLSCAICYYLLYSIICLPLFIPEQNIPLLIYNLAGLPPFTGFFMKLHIIQIIAPGWCFLMILFNSLILYAYVRVFLFTDNKKRPIKTTTVLVCSLGLLL